MNFDELDKKMRVYEQSLDQVILPETYMVARLDGRGFTRLTKEICKFEAPFDERFRDLMVNTVEALMDCGFRIAYGFTESDEISLLFVPGDETFGRKVRKYNSTLAGEASAAFSHALGRVATFDCRIVPLPNAEKVRDYFLWRQEDAHRNSLNSYCYWTLRKEGKSVQEATAMLEGKSVSFKNELLFSKGINFDKLPSWQKRGIGIWREQYEKEGFNPIKNEKEMAVRNRLKVEYELPLGPAYGDLIEEFLSKTDYITS
ncbi:tRNA(His) guanylyltransferase Thg1 family protein [Butyrivibrio sp. MC2013]|uniref:tRNA(His) guanylyltransferase Thg1 family protein n=1 Tax=Butyrivibrio sp. MC2013 TaxID=1280686 RepID=UPI000406629B|nr:tRNA(His) guanylyltransferase Thg1 family protein [Butyrivibrio sp. MC2013]